MKKVAGDNIFVDTNIIIGAFAGLEKDKNCLKYLFSSAIDRRRLFLSSLSIAQFVATFQRRKVDDEKIRKHVNYLLAKFNIINFTEKDIVESLKYDICDMEDSMQFVLCNKMNCNYFITNNTKDFKNVVNLFIVSPKLIRSID